MSFRLKFVIERELFLRPNPDGVQIPLSALTWFPFLPLQVQPFSLLLSYELMQQKLPA